MSTPTRPRVLLIEDDAPIQQFVRLALEDFALELVVVADVAAALAALAQGPVALILSDLMLPGLTGFDLVERLAADPALRGPARIAIFSGALDAQARARLDRPEVWRLLAKPCRLDELEACVEEALAAAAAVPKAVPPAPQHPAPADPIALHFGGDAALFAAFRAACLERFGADIDEGDRATASGDLAALHHLAHSLKTVLRMLGQPRDASIAHALEAACADGEADAGQALWPALRRALAALR
ncbi:MAG: response regulator [Pelomonas sp.]|nr:response regulator [Roseateles sp.]